MPAKDRYHDVCKEALIKAGWTITDEPVTLEVEDRTMWIDIEASKVASGLVLLIEALANALGKIFIYRLALEITGVTVPLYLAITQASYNGILSEQIGRLAIERTKIPLIVFDEEIAEFVQWIP